MKSVAFLIPVFVVISMEEKILVILIGDGNHTAAIFHGKTLCHVTSLLFSFKNVFLAWTLSYILIPLQRRLSYKLNTRD